MNCHNINTEFCLHVIMMFACHAILNKHVEEDILHLSTNLFAIYVILFTYRLKFYWLNYCQNISLHYSSRVARSKLIVIVDALRSVATRGRAITVGLASRVARIIRLVYGLAARLMQSELDDWFSFCDSNAYPLQHNTDMSHLF